MALPRLEFTFGGNGLGIIADGEDHISALVLSGTPPASFGAANMKSFNDIKAVVAAGIVKTNAATAHSYYQISEFFRVAPSATLWVCFNMPTTPQALADALLTGASGKIRQCGVFNNATLFAPGLYGGVHNITVAAKAPIRFIMGLEATTAITASTLDTLLFYGTPSVSILAAGDGGNEGAALASNLGKVYIPAVGAVLGLMARTKVSESLAYARKGNIANATREYDVVKLITGVVRPTDNQLIELDDKGYIALRKHTGIQGTYVTKPWTCTTKTDDYSRIQHGRIMDKVMRLINAQMLPNIEMPVFVTDEGTLDIAVIKFLESEIEVALAPMRQNSEFSNITYYINPAQNVLATELLIITVEVTPVGVASVIRFELAFRNPTA